MCVREYVRVCKSVWGRGVQWFRVYEIGGFMFDGLKQVVSGFGVDGFGFDGIGLDGIGLDGFGVNGFDRKVVIC